MSNYPALTNNLNALIPHGADRDVLYRMRRYVDWLNETRRPWWQPDLVAYRDFLLHVGGNDGNGLAPSSVVAHLSTIRGRYQSLLRDPAVRAEFLHMAGNTLAAQGYEDTPANRKAVVDEIRAAIQDAIHPTTAPVEVYTDQDPIHVRLTVAEANQLLRAATNARDRAMIALMLATGLREAELVSIEVHDLRARMPDGALALHVRFGKGRKRRMIPYGEHVKVLRLVDAWLREAEIASGRVFPFTTRTVQRMMNQYVVWSGEQWIDVKPHDLRRTYARRLYESGMRLEAIQQNLGHADPRTTIGYIGELDSTARQPGEVFDFELG